MGRAVVVAAATAVVFLAACGGGTEAGEAPSSPLAEFLGEPSFFGGDPDDAERQFIEQERIRQETIAECMKEAGFEYTVEDPQDFAIFGDEEDGEFGSDEWAAKYGFGISTQRYSQAQVGPGLVGYDDSGFFSAGPESDPNYEYAQSLGEAGEAAFYAALYGDEGSFPELDQTLSDEEREALLEDLDFSFEPSGCEGEAYAEDASTRLFQEFGTELQELQERIQADPRIAEAEREVGDCVSEKGLTYTGMSDLREDFERDLSEIDNEAFGGAFEVIEEPEGDLTEEELRELYAPPELSDEAKDKLAEIQEREIILAQAVNECGGGFEDQQRVYAEVAAEYEQQFIDDNADRLAEFKAE